MGKNDKKTTEKTVLKEKNIIEEIVTETTDDTVIKDDKETVVEDNKEQELSLEGIENMNDIVMDFEGDNEGSDVNVNEENIETQNNEPTEPETKTNNNKQQPVPQQQKLNRCFNFSWNGISYN